MPLVYYLLSGLTNAGIGEDPFLLRNSSPESHIYKWGEFLGNGILNVNICFDSLLYNVATWSLNAATSILSASVTSRHGFPTSRRGPLERRDVGNQRRDVFNPTLCNVATLPRTSRRRLVPRSVTSRRCPECRNVALFLGQE